MSDQKAVVPYQKLKQLISNDEIKMRFREVLGDKAAPFMASVLNTVYLSDNLRECEPNSILNSALVAATLDLPIDPNIGLSWLIPYKGKAAFQVGYKGFIQLCLRTNQYEAINATPIYQGQEIVQDQLTGRVKLNGKRLSDEVIGYASYFRLLGGFEHFLYMTVDELKAHAKKYSKSYQNNPHNSLWTTNFDAMARKTVLKLNLSKYGIMSVQMQHAIKEDDRTEAASELTETPKDVIDASFSEPLQPEPEPPADEPEKFDPVQVLIEGGSANEYAAKNLLKMYVPDEAKATKEKLVAWNNLYRAWKAQDLEAPEAASKATAGEIPQ